MIPLVFYACDEEDYTCSSIIWRGIHNFISNYKECWSLVNIKKAFLPKLYSLLRRNTAINREAMYACMLPLVKNMPAQSVVDDIKLFYYEILSKMQEG